MATSKSISDTSYHQLGNMTCRICNKEVTEGLYLVVEHYFPEKRGNDDDWNEARHKECSAGDKTWDKYYKQIEKRKTEQKKELNLARKQLDHIIKFAESVYIAEDNRHEFTITVELKSNLTEEERKELDKYDEFNIC